MIRRKLGAILSVALGALILGSTVPAAAVPPETTRLHLEDRTLVFEEVCDFPFQVVFDVDLIITLFFDKDGSLTRRVVHVRETNAVFTNLETGKSLEDPVLGSFRQITPDLVPLSDEVTWTGLFFHLTLPGQGSVVLDAGKIIEDLETGELIFGAGPKPFETEGWAVLCPILA